MEHQRLYYDNRPNIHNGFVYFNHDAPNFHHFAALAWPSIVPFTRQFINFQWKKNYTTSESEQSSKHNKKAHKTEDEIIGTHIRPQSVPCPHIPQMMHHHCIYVISICRHNENYVCLFGIEYIHKNYIPPLMYPHIHCTGYAPCTNGDWLLFVLGDGVMFRVIGYRSGLWGFCSTFVTMSD